MKQCKRCYRFLSDIIDRCLYCKHTELKQLDFISSPLNDVIEIYFHDIVVDDQAYNIIKLLGKGGFGTVIQVSDPTDKKLYAMKVPLIFDEIFTNKKGNQEEEIKRSQKFLEKEIELFLKYRDETFLCFYKKGTARSSLRGKTVSFPVLIMELAQGTVKDIIKYEKESNKVSEDEKVKIIREIVNSISNLHGKGVLHRDLSPDNLFVVDRGGRISYVLGDLGACKDLYKDYSKGISSEILLGHRPYIDPCRFYKEYKNDHRNDVYSLGIIITEILLGKFWPDFLKIEDIPHVLNFDFENEFLLRYGIKFIRDQEIIEVLRKALKKDIKE
ncbi:MAG: protein kinase [Candidatus Aminicenantes bacterium]|jgi:serine/threonine protein kinase